METWCAWLPEAPREPDENIWSLTQWGWVGQGEPVWRLDLGSAGDSPDRGAAWTVLETG